MKPVFADTFYWIALPNHIDTARGRANDVANDIVTTEEVLTEYLNCFCDGPAHLRRKASLVLETVFEDLSVRLIPQSHDTFRAGLTLYRARPDKGYSLTDAFRSRQCAAKD